ncbi:hypothetical protein BMS3Abin16_00640 [archaeon BMS3Abin16]|nr:hypothetical protein BMS3Abin16_00640 [archaeon BMS3Abin16]GBE56095.1 hypothetical protein BMS3Bbin16_00293 [archaeon BMS3Bbin16]HDY74197.1 hypothetical protein [Euryarchaeota archaeon]
MAVDVITYVLGTVVLIVTAVSAYYANELRSALAGSELADVWKHVGIGVILLFVAALAGGAYELAEGDALKAVLFFMLLSALFLVNGLKLQYDKVK